MASLSTTMTKINSKLGSKAGTFEDDENDENERKSYSVHVIREE